MAAREKHGQLHVKQDAGIELWRWHEPQNRLKISVLLFLIFSSLKNNSTHKTRNDEGLGHDNGFVEIVRS